MRDCLVLNITVYCKRYVQLPLSVGVRSKAGVPWVFDDGGNVRNKADVGFPVNYLIR